MKLNTCSFCHGIGVYCVVCGRDDRGDVCTRAAQIAAGAVKDQIRSQGRKLREIEASELRSSIKRYLNEHPELLERAAAEVAAWKKGRRIRVRETPDFWALLHR